MRIDEALAEAAARAERGEVQFPRDLHGFPGTVHGGAVAALFDRLTRPRPPVRLELRLLRGVPTGVPLRLSTGSAGSTARLALARDDRRLAEAVLTREVGQSGVAAALLAAWAAHAVPEGEVPGTASCLACGAANPTGLGVRFLVNDRFLWREVVPPEGYRLRDGTAHPALATILLDELGWWLGALAQQECGVTTDVEITVLRSTPPGPLLVLGDRETVRADGDPRGRYSHARGHVLAAGAGDLVAVGDVRFAGSRAYTRRLLEPFLETTDLATLARLFPGARSARAAGSDGDDPT